MTEAEEIFLRWIAENVRLTPSETDEAEAARLAAEFEAYARDIGLDAGDLEELELESGEDLTSRMRAALEAVRARSGT